MATLTYDTPADVEPGDIIKTTAGTCYLVLTSREVVRRDPAASRRLKLLVDRLTPDQVPPDAVVHPLFWYSRNRRR